jgi:hypothetical protein
MKMALVRARKLLFPQCWLFLGWVIIASAIIHMNAGKEAGLSRQERD